LLVVLLKISEPPAGELTALRTAVVIDGRMTTSSVSRPQVSSAAGGQPAGLNPHLLRLSTLLDLQYTAAASRKAELAYLIVNDTATIIPYQQAALWRHGKLASVSGVASSLVRSTMAMLQRLANWPSSSYT
jgi:hypothetical protein